MKGVASLQSGISAISLSAFITVLPLLLFDLTGDVDN